MPAWRQAIGLSIGAEDLIRLGSIARSRTEPASRVERAQILLAYREDQSFFAVGRALGVHHQTVQRCVERALAYGAMAALDDRPRPGKEPTITAEAKAWLVSLACRKAKELGYRTNCGRHGCWLAMRASMDRRKGIPVSTSWRRVRCARSSTRGK
jgi:transposase